MSQVITVRGLSAQYGDRPVLNSIDLSLEPGEIVAIIGHNGAGKSTLLKALYGLVSGVRGTISYDQLRERELTPRVLRRSGVSYQGQGNRVFSNQTVRENLEVAASLGASTKGSISDVVALFPLLAPIMKKKAHLLSGGQKQALALACTLVCQPSVMLLDEPTAGLSEDLVRKTFELIQSWCSTRAVSCVIAEHRVLGVLQIADRAYAIRAGAVCYSGSAQTLLLDPALLQSVYL